MSQTCKDYCLHSLPGDGALVCQINDSSRRIKILDSPKARAAEGSLETIVLEGTHDSYPAMVKRVSTYKAGFDETIKIHRSCQHDRIVKVYDVESDNRYHYVALEKCEYNLEEYLVSHTVSLHILRGIVNALIYLNGKSIVHGNLNASNILIKCEPVTPYNSSKLCGFSRSKRLKKGGSRSDIGGSRSDMYDLGLLLLFCVTHDGVYRKQGPKEDNRGLYQKLKALKRINGEAYDIISKLLVYEMHPSLTYKDVLRHPFFRLRFSVF